MNINNNVYGSLTRREGKIVWYKPRTFECVFMDRDAVTHPYNTQKDKKTISWSTYFFIVTTNWSPWSKKKRFICIPVNFSPFFSQFDRVLCILADLCVFLFIYRARVYLDLKGEITLRDPWNTLVNGKTILTIWAVCKQFEFALYQLSLHWGSWNWTAVWKKTAWKLENCAYKGFHFSSCTVATLIFV